ncbi:50S ribosomal protein L3 [Mycoplasmoides pirum]|uniref:50S ribosomal protein L3 n=1 Tax=Mycoplasmoides pirum TaxID=2122 RepID=UPI000483F683|nr:50S ribosomal protein L3 [Mycoplasmoides pirum]
MKGIFGTKIGMTQIFEKNGRLIPVTILHVEENQVVSIKTKEKDGYDATLLGFKKVDAKKLNNPQKGLFKKTNVEPRKVLQEIRGMTGYSIGQVLKVDELFQQGQCIDVQGTTKGHGFTGAIKRWNFKIGPLGHGAGYPHRFQGSVQTGRGGSQAQRVFKGKKMSGHYGHDICTIQNLSIVAFKPEENLVLVSGAVPGPSGQMVRITISKKHPNKIYTYDIANISSEKTKSNSKVEEVNSNSSAEENVNE